MSELLGEGLEAFLAIYDQLPCHGLRVNTLKLSPPEFLKLSRFPLKPVPWCAAGFLLSSGHEAGRHPFHAAGLYYLQEPSAMAVGELTGAQPGERILDLCAAPGGKATHLAAQLGRRGVLVANETHLGRVRALTENLERWGATNAIITNETPERLASRWSGYFDRVLVDAPCSGEGMFRKSEVARQEWRVEHVAGCALRQERILDEAAKLVRARGVLAYATCTFAPEENEGVIAAFLQRHPDFEILRPPALPGFSPGRPEWISGDKGVPAGLEWTVRLWPHLAPGEGHFIALLRRRGDEMPSPAPFRHERLQPNVARAYAAFCQENLQPEADVPHAPSLLGRFLYAIPTEAPDLAGLRILRPGWLLGAVQKERFEPSHALALGLTRLGVQRVLDLSPDEERVHRYLRGEVLDSPGEPGWTMITVAGYPLGWGKQVGNSIKNHYPHPWRWTRQRIASLEEE